jgi:hypothetical protein
MNSAQEQLYCEAIRRYMDPTPDITRNNDYEFVAFLGQMGHWCVGMNQQCRGVSWCGNMTEQCKLRPKPVSLSQITINAHGIPTASQTHKKTKSVLSAKPKVAKRSASGEKKKKTVKHIVLIAGTNGPTKKQKKHASPKKAKKSAKGKPKKGKKSAKGK